MGLFYIDIMDPIYSYMKINRFWCENIPLILYRLWDIWPSNYVLSSRHYLFAVGVCWGQSWMWYSLFSFVWCWSRPGLVMPIESASVNIYTHHHAPHHRSIHILYWYLEMLYITNTAYIYARIYQGNKDSTDNIFGK